jgi:hypothetical protein
MTLNVPHVPPGSFHHPVATFSDVQIPKTRITNTPQLRTKSLGFTFSEIPFAKISTLVKSTSPDFSQNNFAGKFSRNFPKIFFPPNETIARFAISQKCRIALLTRILHPVTASRCHP